MRSPFGRRLAEARRTAGLSRESAAIRAGKSYSSIAAYESGSVVPPLDVVIALAAAYGVSVDDIVNGISVDDVVGVVTASVA